MLVTRGQTKDILKLMLMFQFNFHFHVDNTICHENIFFKWKNMPNISISTSGPRHLDLCEGVYLEMFGPKLKQWSPNVPRQSEINV